MTFAETDREFAHFREGMTKRIRELQYPPERLRLPEKLEERRQQYYIPNGAFEVQAVFDRLYVWQIPPEDKTWSGLIQKPETTREREYRTCPEGIIVSAGLMALDALKAHGMDIGEHIFFQRLSPFRTPVDYIDGHEMHLITLAVGEITGSRDLIEKLRKGTVRLDTLADKNRGLIHFYHHSGVDWLARSEGDLSHGRE